MRDLIQKSVLNGLYFSGLQAASTFWAGGIGAILMLHHVRENSRSQFSPNRHLQITPDFLDNVLQMVRKSGCKLVSLDRLHARFSEKKYDESERLVAITLDDGYRDNLQNAVPIFRKHNAPFTIFIAPGLIDGRADLWWEDLSAIIAARDDISIAMPTGRQEFDVSTLAQKERVYAELLQWLTNSTSETDQRKIVRELAWMYNIDTREHAKKQIMNWAEIAELATDPLCTIGAHTIHHYALARLSLKDATWEMRESAGILKAELGEMPRHFAYPYGHPAAAGTREFELAAELDFKFALTTRHGVLQSDHRAHMHALPRISLNGNFQSVRHARTLLSGLPAILANRGRRLNVG